MEDGAEAGGEEQRAGGGGAEREREKGSQDGNEGGKRE
jgi:hypothetical protein